MIAITFENINEDVMIQYQEHGNWITVESVPNSPPLILQGMERASNYYEGKRVRAVDTSNRLVDIL